MDETHCLNIRRIADTAGGLKAPPPRGCLEANDAGPGLIVEAALSRSSAARTIGVALYLVDLGRQAVDTGSAVGWFSFLMLAGVAEMERNLIRERTMAALTHQAAQGRRVGTVALGFAADADGRLVVNDRERPALEALEALRASRLNIRQVATAMNASGVPARGQRWHPTTVAQALAKLVRRR